MYSAAKQNPALSLYWAKAPEVGLPRPDMVLFLDLEEKVAREKFECEASLAMQTL